MTDASQALRDEQVRIDAARQAADILTNDELAELFGSGDPLVTKLLYRAYFDLGYATQLFEWNLRQQKYMDNLYATIEELERALGDMRSDYLAGEPF